MRLICAGLSDVGIAREHNEDNFWLSEDGEPLCIVADGMGGHRSGEIASQIAVESIVQYYRDTMVDAEDDMSFKSPFGGLFRKKKKNEMTEEQRLVQSLLHANRSIYDASSKNELYKGMGTTCVSAYFVEDGVYVAHIGDSRCYRFRKGKLELITEDHSLANEYVRMGILQPEDLEHFPYKNVVTRACGLAPEVEVDINFFEIEDGDIYLLCSDGLTDCASDEKVRGILVSTSDLDEACEKLVDAANAGGGTDNITVILAQTRLA